MKKEKSKKFSRAKRIILIILFLWLLLLIAGVVVINVFTVEHVKIEGNEL
jgi:cell division septal protein FtsQ